MREAILAAALVCGACGGGSGGGGGGGSSVTVNGNIAGQPMGAQDAVSNELASGGDSQGFLLITNAASTCSKLTANQQPKNAKAIGMGLAVLTQTGFTKPTAPGTFTVYNSSNIGTASGNAALGQFVATDVACNQTAEIEATSGSMTLTRVDANGYAGSFDVTFSDGSHVTGSFTANRCNALSDTIGGTCT